MRYLLSFAFCFLFLATKAQFKKPVTVQISTPQAQCAECKLKIENFMKAEEGVAKVVVDIKKKLTIITFLSDRTNIENLKTALANLGFDADDVTAEESQYKQLPICCKRESDGGGPPKKKKQ